MFGAMNANAEELSSQRVSAVSTDNSGQAGGGILGGARKHLHAKFEFEDLTCPLNEDGGMITKVVNEAMKTVIAPQGFSTKFIGHDVSLSETETQGLIFPLYRPNCAEPSHLNDHARDLCENRIWSDPLHAIIVASYQRAGFEHKVTKVRNLYGLTICQAGSELPRILGERGVSKLNARIITKGNPAACFKALSAGTVDIAMMPLSTGSRILEGVEKYSQIEQIPELDYVLTLHAVGKSGSARAMLDIEALNLGLSNIRSSGKMMEIAKDYFFGHDHDAKYDSAHNH